MSVEWHDTPDGSWIEAIGYDTPNEEASVRTRAGATYVYSNVPAAVFERFLLADSKGGFLNSELRDVYPYRRE